MNRKQRYSQGVRSPRGSRAHSRGINLIELMIAMVLGLLVVGGAVSIFVTNQQTYATTESLGRIQENTRTAFELMARELREAGGTPCFNGRPEASEAQEPANVLNNPASSWWSNWGNGAGVQGYDDAQALAAPTPPASGFVSRIAGTDAIDILSAAGSGISAQWPGAPGAGVAPVGGGAPAATLFTSTNNHGFQPGDILMVCDPSRAAIFQMTGPAAPPGTDNTIAHDAGVGTPGNCTSTLGSPVRCGLPLNNWAFDNNSYIARLAASRWYVGDNGRRLRTSAATTGSALFRSTLRQGTLTVEEVAEGVTNMQITYLLQGAIAYVPATAIPAALWRRVTAVKITLTMAGQVQDQVRVSTTGADLQRQVDYFVTLRNRNI